MGRTGEAGCGETAVRPEAIIVTDFDCQDEEVSGGRDLILLRARRALLDPMQHALAYAVPFRLHRGRSGFCDAQLRMKSDALATLV